MTSKQRKIKGCGWRGLLLLECEICSWVITSFPLLFLWVSQKSHCQSCRAPVSTRDKEGKTQLLLADNFPPRKKLLFNQSYKQWLILYLIRLVWKGLQLFSSWTMLLVMENVCSGLVEHAENNEALISQSMAGIMENSVVILCFRKQWF